MSASCSLCPLWLAFLVGLLPFEDPAGVVHQHLVQLLVRDTLFLECRNDVIMNMKIVPSREQRRHHLLRQPMHETGGIMRQDHLTGVPAAAHFGYRLDTILKGQDRIDSKPVHSDSRS